MHPDEVYLPRIGDCRKCEHFDDSYWTYIAATWTNTNIPKPENVTDNNIYINSGTGDQGPPVNLIDLFGISCVNSTWYATKYPFGIEYSAIIMNVSEVEGNGYMTEISMIFCMELE
ncbi:unnamed protein product [Caenorhabditis sp. 36 PRJEB53466]|nr:unnamed protein product [Caenorhabditis sp. 36 PRJEB53466]